MDVMACMRLTRVTERYTDVPCDVGITGRNLYILYRYGDPGNIHYCALLGWYRSSLPVSL